MITVQTEIPEQLYKAAKDLMSFGTGEKSHIYYPPLQQERILIQPRTLPCCLTCIERQ